MDDDHGDLTPEDEFLETVATEGFAVAAEPQHEQPTDPEHLHLAAMAGAVVVGVLASAQARINGGLAHVVDDPLLAAVVSFGGGLLILCVIVLLRRSTRTALLVVLPERLRAGDLRWWQLIGGLAGALYVACQGLAIPSLGVALFTVLIVAGTTGSSLLVDSMGLGPGGRRPVTKARVVGAVGTTVAVLIAVSGRFSTGSLALAAVVLTVTAGFLQTFQQAVNGQVAMRTGDPLVATFINFLMGLTALVTALGIEHLVLHHAWISPPAPWVSPILWSGGIFGIIWIMTAARVVRPLGVLLFALLSIGGQLLGSLVLDIVVPTPGTVVGWQLVRGVALTGAAVAFAAVRR